MSSKPGYKNTEIGEIPEEWEVTRLDALALANRGAIKIGPFGSQLKKQDLSDSGIKVYGQENVMLNNFTLGDRYVSYEKYQALKGFEIFPGDILITMMGSLGFSIVVPPDARKGIMDSHLLRIQVDQKKVLSEFVALLLRDSDIIKRQIRQLSQGAIMSGLNSKIVRSFLIPLPSQIEQQRIVSIILTLDKAIQKTDEIIAKTQQLKKGLMQQLMTKGISHTRFKQTEIGEISEEWDVVKLRSIVEDDSDIVAGPFGSNLKVKDYTLEGVPIIRLQNIERNEFIRDNIRYTSLQKARELIYHSFRPGDIVLAKLGDPIGKTCIVPADMGQGIIVADVVRIRLSPSKAINFFIEYVLNSTICLKQLTKEIIGTTRPRVNINQVRNLKLPLPPLPEQKKIASILESIDEKIDIDKLRKQQLEQLKKGLMQVLLTGKVRVKVD